MMWDSGEGMGWWMMLGSVWMVFFWGVIIWAVIRITTNPDETRNSVGHSALDIAKRRYAAGELSREDFELLRKDLGQ